MDVLRQKLQLTETERDTVRLSLQTREEQHEREREQKIEQRVQAEVERARLKWETEQSVAIEDVRGEERKLAEERITNLRAAVDKETHLRRTELDRDFRRAEEEQQQLTLREVEAACKKLRNELELEFRDKEERETARKERLRRDSAELVGELMCCLSANVDDVSSPDVHARMDD